MSKLPENMDNLLYFTRRSNGDGKIIAWVNKQECQKCHKAKLGKPVEKGKVKMRAKEYVCPACGFTEDVKTHDESQQLIIIYTCPHCKKEGEATTLYKRKNFQGVQAYVFSCTECGQKIPITKKMKEIKSKDEPDLED